jgi:hypothetical protein
VYIYIGIYLYTHHTRWYVCIYIFIHTHTHTHTGAHADAGIRNCMLDLPLYQFNPSEQRKPVEEWTEDQVSVWLGQVALIFFYQKKEDCFFRRAQEDEVSCGLERLESSHLVYFFLSRMN